MKDPVSGRLPLHMLKEVNDHTHLSTVCAQEWVEITVTVDSGASETVAPLKMAEHIPIRDSPASLRGASYEVANGAVIRNLGERRCILQNMGGTEKLLSFQVCDVHKPLLAVSQLVKTGHAVVFHPEWSYIENLATGEKMTLEQREGLYELKAWVRAADEPDFAGPGRRQ